jgi:hypothetical protein
MDLQSRRTAGVDARDRIFGAKCLILDEDTISWISKHNDSFDSLSRGNEIVEQVWLCSHVLNGHNDDVWDNVGQAIGNLQALTMLYIDNSRTCRCRRREDQDSPTPDWERLTRILSRMRQKISLSLAPISAYFPAWGADDCRLFAQAIRGHPTITCFDGCRDFPYESLHALYSGLATLPALESIKLHSRRPHIRPNDEFALKNIESLTELLRVPSLRSIYFDDFYFTHALCEAIASALTEGSAISKLQFQYCSLSPEESAVVSLANGFSKNTSVVSISVEGPLDKWLCYALAIALPSNSTLLELSFLRCLSFQVVNVSPVFLALGRNTGLKTLKIPMCESMDESLCTAIKNGLGMNEKLQSLEIEFHTTLQDNADSWCSAFSFLRANKALKSLVVYVHRDATVNDLNVFRMDTIVAMLEENASLESLSIEDCTSIKMKAEEYLKIITSLQHNTALKSLDFHRNFTIWFTDDENKQIASLLKKNYALEYLPGIDLKNPMGDAGNILRLNAVGRRYLIEDGSSISKGVEVLSAIRSNINCVFLHLLENPRLCDRNALELASESVDERSGSAKPANNHGKREQVQAFKKGK